MSSVRLDAVKETAAVVSMKALTADVYDLVLESPRIAALAAAGQFVMISCGEGLYLRRPISICRIDDAKGLLRLCFQVKGEGTRWLSALQPGMQTELLGPLGAGGFPVEDFREQRILLVGGGIGVFPLLTVADKGNCDAVLGFRNRDAVCVEEDFKALCGEVAICTDDGSYGTQGMVTGLIPTLLEKSAAVFACGPKPMLKAVAELCKKEGKPCFVSLEERMGCGFGVCRVCACKVRLQGKEEYARVCADGPVFNAEEVLFE